jgi:D-cysteine desulfhydrase family pyridoxal phosphate-dependent enzyme
MHTPQSLRKALDQHPQVVIAHLPTPFYKLERLTKHFEKFNLFVKRDDQTGLAFGGNKARKLNYIMADVVQQGADCIVTWAGVQSNWCRQVAAAAAQLGLRTVLVLLKSPTSPEGEDGNLLIDHIFDADIRVIDATTVGNMLELEGVRLAVDPVVEDLRSQGYTPYVAPIGGSLVEGSMQGPWGALGYVEGFVEIAEQAAALGVHIDSVVLPTGSAGTQAGLLVGAKLLSPDTRIVGITVAGGQAMVSGYVRSIAQQTGDALGVSLDIADDDVIVLEDYLGEGYGIFSDDIGNAIHLFARTEGLLLDPVYTGKAATGMVDLMAKNYFTEGETILFLHTGGTPALFPYRAPILEHLAR